MLPPKGHLEATELPFRFDKFEEITRKTIFTVLLEAVSLLETVDGGCIQATFLPHLSIKKWQL